MVQNKSIKKNIAMSTLLTTANFVFPLITYSYVARVLTPVGTGKVAFVQAILQYFSYISIGGIPSYGRRECAKIRDDKRKLSHLVQELLLINLVLVVVAYAALFTSVTLVSKFQQYRSLFVIMSMSIMLEAIGVEWLYQALEEYSYITIRSLVCKCVYVLLVFLLIKSEKDYLWYGFLSIFASSASFIFNFVNLKKYISFKKTESYNFKQHFKPIWTFFFVFIVITIYSSFDIAMIGFISTETEVGLYSSALKIKSILLSLSTAVTSVLVPRMAYYFQNREIEQARKLVINSMRISMLLALPLSVYVYLFADNILLFVCGSDYIMAKNTLRVLMLCIIPLILTNLFGNQILIPNGQERRYSQSVFVGLWINLVLNIIMIPVWGACGAAIGTLVTECWNLYWMSGGAKEYRILLLKNIRFIQYIIPLVIGGGGAVIAGKYIMEFSVFWQLCCTTLVFFIPFYVLLILTKEPLIMELLKKCFQRKILNH